MTHVDTAGSGTATRWGRAAVVLITMSVFGPYLAGGIRTEQVAVYGAAVLLCALGLWSRVSLTTAGGVVVALHLAVVGVATIGVVFPPLNPTLHSVGSLTGGYDSLLLPLAVVLVLAMLVGSGANPAALLRSVCIVTVWAMAANTVVAIYSISSNSTTVLALFRLFGEGESVADRAERMGRYSGIFNQPAEAGLLYSVALLAAIYLYRDHIPKFTVSVAALTIGGTLSVSKIFLLVGAPIALAQILLVPGRRRRMWSLALTAVSVGLLTQLDVLERWDGRDFLLRLLPGAGQGDQVTLYTAGRFGEHSSLNEVVGAAFDISPMTGAGVRGLQLPYDNGWVEALVIAGVIGVVLHTALLAALFVGWLHGRSARPESVLAGGLVLAVVGASFGLPAITANRCATIVWLLLGLLLVVARPAAATTWWQRPGEGRHRVPPAVAPRLVGAGRRP
ncbi:hypothetical protein [Micromonospora inaquosa]|uniref:hypothetical protein n=1 Tax=Micromonospora inaquosa TaxID=2203716 RepID=UPI000F5E4439|nr:hypothetical protein [Micromonospora inaquosa]